MRVIPRDEPVERTIADLKQQREDERIRKICAWVDYHAYRNEIARRQINGTFRSGRPKGVRI